VHVSPLQRPLVILLDHHSADHADDGELVGEDAACKGLSWSSNLGGCCALVARVTSFTIIYYCINGQYRAKYRTGAASGGSKQYAYQLDAMLTG
jgi:hypothetical protein